MPDSYPRQRPISRLKGDTNPMRPRRPMKICPDGSRTFADRMCPRPRPKPMTSRKKPLTRAEQFKQERLGK
jgi:hypothetical protein